MRGDFYLINEIAAKISKHKIIPFIGAGCSIPMLKIDWDGIIKEMKSKLSCDLEGHLEIAQDFADKYGKKALCDFLSDYFVVEDFEDETGYSYMALISMGIKLIYTTNQDNVMEMCMAKYGRTFRRIITLDDLAESEPGDSLYIKFHGDLSLPDSIVFTKNDYENRMGMSNHFLDIKIRSDLLGKSLLFIGYSFRDDIIRLIFKELQHAFRGLLPKSYLIAYRHSEELQKICSEYDVEYIAPSLIFKNKSDSQTFEKFLYELVEKAFAHKTKSEIDNLFYPKTPPVNRVINSIEVKVLK